MQKKLPNQEEVTAVLEFVPTQLTVVQRFTALVSRLKEATSRANRIASHRPFAMFFAQQARDASRIRAMSNATRRFAVEGDGKLSRTVSIQSEFDVSR